MKKIFFAKAFCIYSILTLGQNPSANFSILANACTGQNIQIQNLSINASTFEWDFCSGDLENLPVVQGATTSGTFNKPSHITLVTDQGKWYGFVLNRFGNSISRLDFGASLANTPLVVNLGTFNGLFTQPIDIEFFKSGQNWYGLLIDASTNKLWRASFSSIEDVNPTFTSLDNFNSAALMSIPVDI